MDVEKRRYPTDLTETEWAILEPLIAAEKPLQGALASLRNMSRTIPR
jgi:hypothetical protein